MSWTGRGGGRGRAAWSGRGRGWSTPVAGRETACRARGGCGGQTLATSTRATGPGGRCMAGEVTSLDFTLLLLLTLSSGDIQFGSASGRAGQTFSGHFR